MSVIPCPRRQWCTLSHGTLRSDAVAREHAWEMPRKIRQLVADLQAAGFVDRGGKGNHRNFVHPNVAKPITLAGNPGDDAKRYQEHAVSAAIEESKR